MTHMVNAYEEACERWRLAVENHRKALDEAVLMIEQAEAEHRAAEKNLRKYEDSPGVPKQEYRQESTEG